MPTAENTRLVSPNRSCKPKTPALANAKSSDGSWVACQVALKLRVKTLRNNDTDGEQCRIMAARVVRILYTTKRPSIVGVPAVFVSSYRRIEQKLLTFVCIPKERAKIIFFPYNQR